MNNKGDISLNIIIIAAIGLLVLVILSVIFIGKMGITSRGVDDCGTKGGLCVDKAVGCNADNDEKAAPATWKCFKVDKSSEVDADKMCCLKI